MCLCVSLKHSNKHVVCLLIWAVLRGALLGGDAGQQLLLEVHLHRGVVGLAAVIVLRLVVLLAGLRPLRRRLVFLLGLIVDALDVDGAVPPVVLLPIWNWTWSPGWMMERSMVSWPAICFLCTKTSPFMPGSGGFSHAAVMKPKPFRALNIFIAPLWTGPAAAGAALPCGATSTISPSAGASTSCPVFGQK